MSHHLSMGAINKNTNEYEMPRNATKENKYKCPECNGDVIFRKGKIKIAHFSHKKSDNPCYYYDKPTESQIHKDAKLLMKSLLDHKKNINIYRTCVECGEYGWWDSITEENYNETSKTIMEYRFNYKDSVKIADVAFINLTNISYIFEICYRHKTKEENRPEPWAEINAEKLISDINSDKNIDKEGNIGLECIRYYKCDTCVEKEEYENRKRILYYETLRKEQLEREKIEKERQEKYKKEQEELRKYQEKKEAEWKIMREEELERRREEAELQKPCKCGIRKINICICETPNYEMNKLSNNLFCVGCNNWKCRCCPFG